MKIRGLFENVATWKRLGYRVHLELSTLTKINCIQHFYVENSMASPSFFSRNSVYILIICIFSILNVNKMKSQENKYSEMLTFKDFTCKSHLF